MTRFQRLLRFAGVGVVNTGVYYALYLLLHTAVPYLVAHICAFVLAMVVSYFLNCAFTFHTRPRWRTFLLYPLSNLANFLITTIGLRLAVGSLGMDERIAPLVVAVVAIPITYVVVHAILIERTHHPHHPASDPHHPASPESSPDPTPPLSSDPDVPSAP